MCAAKRPRDGDDASTPVAIFLFRRDFRLHDNTALNQLIHHINNKNNTNIQIIPIFIFNPRQCDATRNPYFSDASFGFLCESLLDLDGGGGGNENDADVGAGLNGTLVCMEAQDDATCLAHVLKAGYRIVAIATNADVTPFAKERDAKLHDWCATHDVVLILGAHDYQLLPPDVVRNTSGGSYRIFTPYYHCVLAKHAANIPREASIPSSSSSLRTSLWCVDARQRLSRHLVNPATRPLRRLAQPRFHGGRCRGLALLHRVVGGEMANYVFDRNALAEERTSFLSPYLKYGCISVREVWWAAVSAYGLAHEYTRQLVWREFFTMLICQHPQLLQGQLNEAPATTTTRTTSSSSSLRNATLLAKYNNFEWSWDDEHFAAFRRGETGVPLVDASVRCLTQTGWCSNRCRMIVAHMLVKVLGVDWRDGERWYASVALDYDPCNNSGGWQWSSGQGCEAQFRHHNFYRQSSMYDPLAIFIHRWIPELREVPPKMIHAWDVVSVAPRPPSTQKISYPAPMVDVRAMSEKMMIKYKQHTTNNNNNNTNNIRQ